MPRSPYPTAFKLSSIPNPRFTKKGSHSQCRVGSPAEAEPPILEGEFIPIDIPNIDVILRQFKKTDQEHCVPGSTSIVLGFGPTEPLQWLVYRPGAGFFSLITGESFHQPNRFLQLTGSRHTSTPPPVIPVLSDVLAYIPSAVSAITNTSLLTKAASSLASPEAQQLYC